MTLAFVSLVSSCAAGRERASICEGITNTANNNPTSAAAIPHLPRVLLAEERLTPTFIAGLHSGKVVVSSNERI
jgi:hypothetical protein